MNNAEAIKVLKKIRRLAKEYDSEDAEAFDMAIKALSTESVSKAVVEQIQWERDLAIQQLNDLGYELGEKPRKEYVTPEEYMKYDKFIGENRNERGGRMRLPIMIGKNLKKGILTMRSKQGGFDVLIVWLDKDKDYERGQEYDLEDVDKVNAILHFCDRESVENTIKALKWILKQWKVPKDE